jgi:MoaD family protein
MQVNFYGTYRLITGAKLCEMETFLGDTIRDLLQAVTARYPALRNELFDEHGNLYPYIPLYINGRNPRLLAGGLDTLIKPEDVLSIFSPISSGRINVEAANQALSD